MRRNHPERPTIANPHELLLVELKGHPLQDYVDTVRAVTFLNEAICKSFCPPREALCQNARGSERFDQAVDSAGVKAEIIIHILAHKLFTKNNMG